MPETNQTKYSEKIAKILRQAEDPSISQEEADTFFENAQRLMTKYAIDEAMIAAANDDGKAVQESIIFNEIKFKGIYHQALYDIGAAVARANDCSCLIQKGSNYTTLIVNGFKSDVARVQLLNTSLQIQASGAMIKWWKAEDVPNWYTGMEKYKARRGFFFGFASGLKTKLDAAAARGKEDAVQAQAERSKSDVTDASESVELVIRDKKAKVKDWMDHTYGRSLRSVSRNYSRGGMGGQSAGFTAGQQANTSTGAGVGGRAAGALNR